LGYRLALRLVIWITTLPSACAYISEVRALVILIPHGFRATSSEAPPQTDEAEIVLGSHVGCGLSCRSPTETDCLAGVGGLEPPNGTMKSAVLPTKTPYPRHPALASHLIRTSSAPSYVLEQILPPQPPLALFHRDGASARKVDHYSKLAEKLNSEAAFFRHALCCFTDAVTRRAFFELNCAG
jgi:hypothetical protein